MFLLTPRALGDLEGIADYTSAQWGETQMGVDLRSLSDRFAWLAENPRLGRMRPEVAPDLRSYREGSRLIFYRVRPGRIEIIGLPHQALDLDAYVQSEG